MKILRPWKNQRARPLQSDPYSIVRARLGVESGPANRQITLRLSERDEIMDLNVSLPGSSGAVAVRSSTGGITLPPGVTDVVFEGADHETVSIDEKSVSFSPGRSPEGKWGFTAALWHCVRWQTERAPYLRANFDLELHFKGLPSDTVVLLDVPADYRPASLQGNYHLAHPSQRRRDRRVIPIFFARATTVKLKAVITRAHLRPEVWLSAGKGALLIAFAILLGWFSSPFLDSERAVLLLGALAGIGFYFADVISDIIDAEIYSVGGSLYRKIEVLSVVLSTGVYVWLAIPILGAGGEGHTIPHQIVALIAIVLLSAVSAVGLVGHRLGVWQGYKCDIASCIRSINLRYGHFECYYTGRVPCAKHIFTMCKNCQHFTDLGSSRLETLAEYAPEHLPCRQNG